MTDSTQAQAEPEGTDKGIVVTPPFSPHQLESRKGKSESTSVPGHNLLSLSPLPSPSLPLSPTFTWFLRTGRR